ncbi:hypothetical protein M422DRAFT_270259 [Sphaerobolus stellatus SS14]|uniref:PAS domain-containing protein n=1 Tax=Sphaerobolus stellatus (strain SS14) TaxID=990650 RepID=A0A0C9UHS1_SPHS4|nr:hypothetical protein M422DRAFT_270259 [Sphaerobolus stellatus SS14]
MSDPSLSDTLAVVNLSDPALKVIVRRRDAQSVQAAHCIELTLYPIFLPDPRGAKMLYLSPSLTEVLGFEPGDVLGQSSFDRMHPDEVETVKQLHYNIIREDRATAIAYLYVKNQEDVYVSSQRLSTPLPNSLGGYQQRAG